MAFVQHKTSLAELQRIERENDPGTKRADRFLQELFEQGEVYRVSFDRLTNAGCPDRELGKLIFAICTLSKWQRWKIIQLGVAKEFELEKLANKLREVADAVERTNQTAASPLVELSARLPTVDSANQGKMVWLARLCRLLPLVMRLYSSHLEHVLKLKKTVFKRLSWNHHLVLQLLRAIEERAGTPHYEDLATLLQGGYWVARGKLVEPPDFFTAEALAKLYQRYKHLAVKPLSPQQS